MSGTPHRLDNYVGLIGSTTATPVTLNQRVVRVDTNGRLEVIIFGAGAVTDVNLLQVAGTAVVEAGLAGVQAIGGPEADGAAAVSNPVQIAGVDGAGNIEALLTDTDGRPQDDIDRIGGTDVVATGVAGMMPVAGDVADDAASSASNPVKVGAVADQVPSTVADDDLVHLITDLERYLRIVSKSFDTLTASDKVAVQNTIASDRDYAAQTIANVSNQAAVKTNYPSDAGLEIGNRDFISAILSLEDVTSVTTEVSNDGTNWVDCSASPVDAATGLNGYAAAHWTSAAGVTTHFAADWEKCGYRYIRWGVTPPNATNTILITVIARAH